MTLLEDMKNCLPKSMYIPKEIIMLLKWIEKKGFVHERNGQIKGYLLDITREEDKGIYFSSENREIWHFRDNTQAKERFFPIAYIDERNGSGCIGLWLDNDKKQQLVIVGNENATPMLFCTLGEPITLLKFLAIGYINIFYWLEYYDDNLDVAPSPNYMLNVLEYCRWLEDTLHVTIPKMASEILPLYPCINSENSKDIFLGWDRKHNKLWKNCRYKKVLYDKINKLFPEVNLKREGFYNYISLSLFGEIISWLESADVDTRTPKVAKAVKEITTWVITTKQPEEDYGCIHFFTEYIVSFVEEIFRNKKLHHLIPHNIYEKEDVLNNKEFIMGYMSASKEDYLHVLSLFDEIKESRIYAEI